MAGSSSRQGNKGYVRSLAMKACPFGAVERSEARRSTTKLAQASRTRTEYERQAHHRDDGRESEASHASPRRWPAVSESCVTENTAGSQRECCASPRTWPERMQSVPPRSRERTR